MHTTPTVGVDPASPTPLSGQPVHPATGLDQLCQKASDASGQVISPTLYNVDLAPTMREGRRWSGYSIFTLWANDVHSLGNYAFAVGLFALGLGAWQILLALGIGAALLFGLLNLSGFMGVKTGVPFPVMSRISFGIRGAQIASLLRGAVAIAWFGIQTYLASVVFRVMLIAMVPSLASLDANSILGLSSLGWIAFGILWIVQLVIVSFGMEMIRKYEAFAGPVILVTMAAVAIWIFTEAGGAIAWSSDNALEGPDMWLTIFAGGALWVSIYGTFVLNFCDFTRSAVSKKAVVRGNFWGIPINMLVFGAIVVVMAGGQFKINGTIIESPSDIVQTIPNTILVVLACLALLILTIAVNLMANFVAPVYALTNLFPKRLNFRRAAAVSAVIGLVILPWNLYNNPLVILYFLGGLGALLGPLFGVVMADYWLIRRGKVNVPELYTASPGGAYFYRNGVNPKAITAMVPAAAVALAIAFVPPLAAAAPFAWFFAAGIAAVVYYLISDRSRQFEDVNGEAIAVPSNH
ncbi:NCS1 family nucleobase:cation symporter-1 [Pseudarthrobacter sp. J75]|uniref:NCS1 family nucleobase:cation symporter-1 n=1 Tax=unclassified Pseudarthrobacter TaxID=2647000 RepID=UPI002E81BB6E|nr:MULTISPECIES: NCS1 family nucleobase:cation symporter-1 [unclassified Pseudarthrobacter]MEE2522903.1 NCS1 family nucleobase:cation symporter-1 [Pseudarthrobacter sp. J47]MEE2530622.1 NCS1 family nucleobase:cation symporter-1 [Pseudarthrobacter sp. J75]MEE2568538.1 NCS1 family nucleobase:cation symporter-1 [Pseudarthrobacter sp. J64]